MNAQVPLEDPEPPPTETGPARDANIAGERHIPSVNRVRSLQSRITTVLSIAVMGTLALALLAWYYSRAFARHDGLPSSRRAQTSSDTFLPLPRLPEEKAPAEPIERVLGPPPPPPASVPTRAVASGRRAREKPDRTLSGPVYARQQRSSQNSGASSAGMPLAATTPMSTNDGLAETDTLSPLLQSSARAASAAYAMPSPRWTLPPGTTIDCTLESAITSTLPGMTRCVTASDTWSADGSVILLERGSQLIGETRGQVEQGKARIFVLWNEARTPSHVVVPLASPGTDSLGRAGLGGDIDYHFAQRFGAALLVSVIDGAVQAATQNSRDGDSIVINPNSSRDLLTEILRHTMKIRPSVGVHQGARVQVFVARTVDFGAVYGLRTHVPR